MTSRRLRAPARVSWSAATEAFMLVTDYAVATRATYKGHLKRAGVWLGSVPLGRLTVAELDTYRAAVLAGKRGARAQALTATRVFLVWAAAHGLHPLRPKAIREALRSPGAAHGVEPVGRTTRWRQEDEEPMAAGGERRPAGSSSKGVRQQLPPPAADTLVEAGYPDGAAGLYLVSEEIQALREALLAADRPRWADLVSRTDHPVNSRPGGGAAAAREALRDAASGRQMGREMALAKLGYEGPAGERRLLANLRDLRAALAVQQRGSLGRTVWRLRWTEELIPLLPDRGAQPS